ncbi:MAG: Hsp33 family molecular chaperone HslO [Kiritimatiellae bacterium]|nr:Hsp33 family molecular chaperone HslO [Kiritimatiellia bacterium]MDD3543972.1 Hsp33 family molecular chaperone HslO [Kiritimatiellia bacterium]MDD4024545.1 Hsp33 family molecular chaperone HslO [Kiritimatiellia bacterium]
MAKTADSRAAAFSPAAKIRLVLVEVTDSARELERSHLCGPTAGMIQAEALAGVALLGSELAAVAETVTMRLKVSGPVGGVLVEAGADGSLRGYTNVKVMNDLDAREELDVSVALGEQAEMQIIRSVPGRILDSAATSLSHASVTNCVELYFRQSLQRPVLVQIAALSYGGFLEGARGLMVEKLPDGDDAVFARLSRYFEDGTLLECLECAASLKTVCETVGLEDCVYEKPFPLRFACRCSEERVAEMLTSLPVGDLKALILEDRPAQIFCQMCGKGYQIGTEQLREILKKRG